MLSVGPYVRPEIPDNATIQQAFEAFHRANPWVYRALEQLTADQVAQGRERVGIGMLFEVVRWHHSRSTTDESSGFRLNNNYRSRYVRMLTAKHPEWHSLFAVRELRAA